MENKNQPKKEEKQASVANATQKIETAAYVPTYKIKPEFKQVVLKAIGDRPFNEIAGLINAIEVEVIDHQSLDQVLKALGQFPYIRVEGVIRNINSYVTLVIQD